MAGGAKLWEPDQERIQRSHMTRFMAFAAARTGQSFADFAALHHWSITDLSAFWEAVAAYTAIKWQKPATEIFVPPPAGHLRGGHFFLGGQLNFAENLLQAVMTNPEREVLTAITEKSPGTDSADFAVRQTWTGTQLLAAVAACAAALRQVGVKKGDRVAAVIANGAEAIIAMLASTSLGAIWSSCSPDFGVSGTLDRLSQIEPVIVFFSSDYSYNGKVFDCTATIASCLSRLPSVRFGVVIASERSAAGVSQLKRVKGEQLTTWQEFLAAGAALATPLKFEPTDFAHPLYIMFSSGTTGVPKCIVHGVGGTLLQHKKELLLHSDLDGDGTLLFYTTCGWMMWNWMVSALAVGARLVIYDGAVVYPDVTTLWRIAASAGVTHLGTSPKYISACMAASASVAPYQFGAASGDLSLLRTLLVTGAPLLAEQFNWIYAQIKRDLQVASISGGTDIISCFMLGVPILPVHAGEIQYAGLGMAVEAWNDEAVSVREQKAELVCTQPFVSMPIGFWNDPDGQKYTKAYFKHFSGRSDVWWHGDFIEITKTGGVIVYGRSDATLNPGGVRIGTAELYRQLEDLPEILDAIAVGQKSGGDVQIVLFVKLRPPQKLTADLAAKIKQTIRQNLTARHVPYDIAAVADIPYTRSGKKVEMAVTQAIHGEQISNLSALANPEVMQEFFDYRKNAEQRNKNS